MRTAILLFALAITAPSAVQAKCEHRTIQRIVDTADGKDVLIVLDNDSEWITHDHYQVGPFQEDDRVLLCTNQMIHEALRISLPIEKPHQ
jgi:hypothetical protein